MENVFSEWVENYTDDLYRWAFTKLKDEEKARDLVQDTFLAAWQNIAKFEGRSQPKTWLLSILNNKIIDQYRKRFREVSISPTDNARFFDDTGHWKAEAAPDEQLAGGASLLDSPEFNQVLQECIERLPSGWFETIQLKYIIGKKGAEICQELSLSSTNYWQILHRAKLQLRKCIDFNWK